MVALRYLVRKSFNLWRNFSQCQNTSKMKVLNVAEKNDAAKTLAGFMSSNIRRREGLSKFNKIYEFECMLLGKKCEMIMTSVSGHLLGFEFVGAYKGWKSCSPLALFDAPLAKQCLSGYEGIKLTLEREIRKCSVLIIWTDCDREGENIGFEIINVCRAVKSNIQIYRAKFSEITYQSVRRALQNLVQPDKRINDAVEVRQELDLRIGAAFTRFQTLRLKQVFPVNLSDMLLSYGSCQFPTLGFVVERYKDIENFIPENFWKIKVCHEANELSVEFNWKRVKLFDKNVCELYYEMCKENPTATVQSVSCKPKSKWRPLPLDTIELEKIGSRNLKINAKEIMRIAERLYTQGFISYPRTETNIFPKELDLPNLIGLQTADQKWGEFANRVVQDGPNPRNGTKSDKAHPPIHPIKYTNTLGGNEQKVYEFVVRRFLACCSKDAQGQETIVEIDIAGERFVANGLMIIARNYLEVYPYERWNAKEIHVYQNGQSFLPLIEMLDGTTSPPKYLTEADLIALMEKHGIGTDATHADHIETIKSRLYVGLENEKFFVPGHLGMGLVEGYDSMGFPMSKPNLRAELEADLVKICEGIKSPEAVLREQLMKYKHIFEIALQQAAKLDEALAVYLQEQPRQADADSFNHPDMPPSIMPCSACGSHMVLRTRKDGSRKFISCMGYPNCKNVIWFPSGVERVEATDEGCRKCGPNTKKLKFTFKRGFLPVFYIPEETSCIGGCDTALLEYLDISLSRVQSNPHQSSLSLNSSTNTFASTQTGATIDIARTDFPVNSAGNPNREDWDSGIVRGTSSNGGRGSASNRGRGAGSHKRRGTEQSVGQRTIMDSFNRPSSSAANSNMDRLNPPNVPQQTSVALNNRNALQRLDDLDTNPIVCGCNVNAILLTARKENANKGRQFYKCGNRQGQDCRFFLWADSIAETPQPHNNFVNNSNTNSMSQPSSSRSNNGPINTASEVHCRCGGPARRLITQKEGPNKGRAFFRCPKSTDSCNFFLWEDESGSNNSGSGATAWQGNNQGFGNTRQSNPNDSKKKRKCGNCHEEGHNKRNCPNN